MAVMPFSDLRFMDCPGRANRPATGTTAEGDYLAGIPEGLGPGQRSLTCQHEQTSEDQHLCRGLPRERPSAESGSLSGPKAPVQPVRCSLTWSKNLGALRGVPEEPANQGRPFLAAACWMKRISPLAEVFSLPRSQCPLRRPVAVCGKTKQAEAGTTTSRLRPKKAEPISWTGWDRARLQESLLTPRVAYGYFPVAGRRHSVVGVDSGQSWCELRALLAARQALGNRYWRRDFYRDLDDDQPHRLTADCRP